MVSWIVFLSELHVQPTHLVSSRHDLMWVIFLAGSLESSMATICIKESCAGTVQRSLGPHEIHFKYWVIAEGSNSDVCYSLQRGHI